MTNQQIRVDALLAVAKQQLEKVSANIEILRALNHGDDMSSYCEISNGTAASLHAACAGLLGAHNLCASFLVPTAQKGGLPN